MRVKSLNVFFLLAVIVSLARHSAAQNRDPFFLDPPYAGWTAQAPQEEIAWKVHVVSGGLTPYQRMTGFISLEVNGRYLKKLPKSTDLVALVQISDSAGHVYQDHSILAIDIKRPDLRNGGTFSWRAFMLPGDYEVLVALYDNDAGKHNIAKKTLHIESPSKDPLPGLWRDLPSLEFLLPPDKQPDSFFHPEISSRLSLPLVTRQPVRVEVLANLTGTGRAMVSHNAYNFNLTSLLPIVKSFSQIDVRNGALNVEVLDLVRRQVAFQQQDVRVLDWTTLSAAVTKADPTTVDVRALKDVKHTALFLRREVAARIEADLHDTGTPPVLILISGSAFFQALDDISDTALSRDCGCLVYYIHYNPFVMRYRGSRADFDNVKKVLKPLQIHTHFAQSPEDLRRIMAEILAAVSEL